MDITTILLIAVVLFNLIMVIGLFVIWKRSHAMSASGTLESNMALLKAEIIGKQMEGLISLRESLDSANRIINERLAEGTSNMDKRMAIISDIDTKLGQLSTQTKNIENIGNNIQSLSDLLKPPKVRGALGEIMLENLLGQILPKPLYDTQYRFDNGQRVDAVVFLDDRIMPVDSKFPLEAFQRIRDNDPLMDKAQKEFIQSLKKHIDDISLRYIHPEQKTTEFAVMYIPSEPIYYKVIAEDDNGIFEYALNKKVIPSSPGHFYAFLASIASIYAQAGLSRDNSQLTESLNSIRQSLEQLAQLNDKMNSSLRRALLNLDKSKDEQGQMEFQLMKIMEPEKKLKTIISLIELLLIIIVMYV